MNTLCWIDCFRKQSCVIHHLIVYIYVIVSQGIQNARVQSPLEKLIESRERGDVRFPTLLVFACCCVVLLFVVSVFFSSSFLFSPKKIVFLGGGAMERMCCEEKSKTFK